MANERKFYCLCEHNCKFETMTKEQILAAIAQAVEKGAIGDVDTGFVSRVVEQNKQGTLYFWVGTQAEYNALEEVADDCHYFITDDSTKADIEAVIANFATTVEALEHKVNPFGAVLFEDTNGVEPWQGEDLWSGIPTDSALKFNASAHNCFLVTLHDEGNNSDINILCTKFKYFNQEFIGGVHTMLYASIGDNEMRRGDYEVTIDLNSFSKENARLLVAKRHEQQDGVEYSADCKVTKIVGLM